MMKCHMYERKINIIMIFLVSEELHVTDNEKKRSALISSVYCNHILKEKKKSEKPLASS